MPPFSHSNQRSNTDRYRNIYLKPKKAGGMKITFQTPPKNLDEKMIANVLKDYKMLNCEVLVRDEYGTYPRHRLRYPQTLGKKDTKATQQPQSTTSST